MNYNIIQKYEKISYLIYKAFLCMLQYVLNTLGTYFIFILKTMPFPKYKKQLFSKNHLNMVLKTKMFYLQ